MKLIASIEVTVQVGPDDWKRETPLYEIKEGETVESLFSRIMQDVKGAACKDKSILIIPLQEAQP